MSILPKRSIVRATSALTWLSSLTSKDHAGRRVAPVSGGDLGGERGAISDVGDHDLGALGRERLRVMAPDAVGAAGDDRTAAGEPRHRLSSFRCAGARTSRTRRAAA